MSSKQLFRKFLLSVILVLSVAIVAVYVFGVYIPDKEIGHKAPVRESDGVRNQ
jgi:hypothetical protein